MGPRKFISTRAIVVVCTHTVVLCSHTLVMCVVLLRGTPDKDGTFTVILLCVHKVVCTNTVEFLYTFIKKIPDKYIWYNVRFSKNLVGTFTYSKNGVKKPMPLVKICPKHPHPHQIGFV